MSNDGAAAVNLLEVVIVIVIWLAGVMLARTPWLSASWPRSGCGGEGDGDGAKCGVEGRMYKMIHDPIFRVRAAGEAVSFSRHADTD